MKNLRTVIIDDEADSIEILRIELQKHCPHVEAVASYTSSVQALRDIKTIAPDLVFIDVEMPVLTGFDLLEQLHPLPFAVIFITAYNQYAIRAFRFNALDYLMKPVDSEELKEAVAKMNDSNIPSNLQLSEARNQLNGGAISRIALPSQNGIQFVNLDQIIYAEASNNYSKLLLTSGTMHIVSKTLKDVQELLEESHFLRVHRQYIINLNAVDHFDRNEGILTMQSGMHIPIVRHQYDKFLDKFYRL